MPYPDLFEEALKVSLKAVRVGGFIHPHLFVEAKNKKTAIENAYNLVMKLSKEFGAVVEPVGGHVIRGVAPRKYHVTVDAIVRLKHQLNRD